jgi:crossover junction endodeoxyribonuclease RuvC
MAEQEIKTGDGVLILGIDPGSINAGYALIKVSGRSVEIVKSGTCKLNQKEDFFNRINSLKEYFDKLIEDFPPFELSMESLIHVKNVSSLAKLAQARGAILASLGVGASSVHEYAPNLVKSTVSGYGLSSKQSLEKSLGFMFPNHTFATHDESDALAIALCHNFKRGQPQVSGSKAPVSRKGRTLKESLKHLNLK